VQDQEELRDRAIAAHSLARIGDFGLFPWRRLIELPLGAIAGRANLTSVRPPLPTGVQFHGLVAGLCGAKLFFFSVEQVRTLGVDEKQAVSQAGLFFRPPIPPWLPSAPTAVQQSQRPITDHLIL